MPVSVLLDTMVPPFRKGSYLVSLQVMLDYFARGLAVQEVITVVRRPLLPATIRSASSIETLREVRTSSHVVVVSRAAPTVRLAIESSCRLQKVSFGGRGLAESYTYRLPCGRSLAVPTAMRDKRVLFTS